MTRALRNSCGVSDSRSKKGGRNVDPNLLRHQLSPATGIFFAIAITITGNFTLQRGSQLIIEPHK